MRGDQLIATQLLVAQAVSAMSEHLLASTGVQLTPVAFADLPAAPSLGMTACVNNSTVGAWGAVIAGGGPFKVQVWYNGVNWTVTGV